MIRPTLKLLRYLAPIAQGLSAAAPLIVWTWKELAKPLAHIPEMIDLMKSLATDPWRPMKLYFVTSDGKRYELVEDCKSIGGVPRFCRDSKAD